MMMWGQGAWRTVEQGHGAVLELHDKAAEGLHHGRDVEQRQDDGLGSQVT